MNKVLFTLKLLLLVLVGITASSCNVVQQAIKKPGIQVEHIKFHPVSLRQGRLDMHLRLENPNSFSLPLRGMRYSLMLDNREFINNDLRIDKTIPANGKIEFNTSINFRFDTLLNGLADFAKSHEVKYQFKGKLDLGLIKVPFTRTGEFSLK